MASKSGNPPPDAVHLTEFQASKYVWDLVRGWKDEKDTWALNYGSGMLGGLCSLSGFFINNHYRTRVRLGKYGVLSTLLPTVALPGVFQAFFHRWFIATDILLQKKDNCFICYELRSLAFQLVFGIGYPMVMGPATTFMLANRYNTIRIPSFIDQPKEWYQFIKKTSKSLSGLLVILTAVQVVGSSVVTYCELRNQIRLQAKINAIENKIDGMLLED